MAGINPDRWIRKMAQEAGMIRPFRERTAGPNIISSGLQPCGYDAILDPEILVFDWAKAQGVPLDPLALDPLLYSEKLALPFFDIPPRGFVQGMTIEYFKIPTNVSVLGRGKTTYTSVGISVNVASINPGWEGRLRLHIANTTPIPIRIYGRQGIVYLEFQELDGQCEVPYDRLAGTRFQRQTSFLAQPP